MLEKRRYSGIDVLGDVPWGTHFCQFYQTSQDLLEVLVGYFQQGLRNNEFCMWVTSEPLGVEEACSALQRVVPDLDDRIDRGQIEFLDYRQWYLFDGRFNANRVLHGWVEKERAALAQGYEGLRASGNMSWLDEGNWKAFTNYEAVVNDVISSHRIMAFCEYPLDRCRGVEMLDVLRNHPIALVRNGSKWEVIESPEQRKTMEMLTASEQQQKAILDTIPDPAWLNDHEGRYLAINPACCRLLGVDANDALGKTAFECLPAEVAERVWKHDRIVMQSRLPLHIEESFRNKNGDLTWFETIKSPLLNDRGEVVGTAGLARDITERKETKDALTESEGRYRSLFNSMSQTASILRATLESTTDGILVVDLEGRIVECNQRFAEIWQIPPELIFYGKEHDLLTSSRDEQLMRSILGQLTTPNSFLAKVAELYNQPEESSFDVLEFKDGRTVERFSQPQRISGQPVGRVWSFRDVTDRRRAETILRAERNLACHLAAAHRQDDIVRLCLDAAIKNSGLECGGIYLAEPTSGELHVVHHHGLSNEFVESVASIPPDSVQMRILRQGQFVEIPCKQMEKIGLLTAIREGLSIIVAIPVMFEQRLVACLNITSRTATSISEFARASLEAVSAQMGAAIVRAQTEAALRESEARFRSVVETSPDGIGLMGLDGRLLMFNQRAAALAGYRDAREMLSSGKNGFDFLAPEERPRVQENVSKILEVGLVPEIEYSAVRLDGSRFPVEISASLVKDADGNAKAMAVVIRDITGRKRAEESLRKSEERYRTLVENISLGITLIDREHQILAINETHAGLVGRSVDECLGQKCFQVFEKRCVVCPHCPGVRAMQSEHPAEVETTGMRDDGTTYQARIQAFPVHGSEGNIEGFIEVVEDITERRRAEMDLERMRRLLSEGQRISHLGSWEYIADTRETVWSEEQLRIYGLNLAGPTGSMVGSPKSNGMP